MSEKNKRKQIAKISIFITSIFVIFLSITYAFINMTLTGTKRQVITTGNLELELDEDENNLQIENALPMYDEVGMLQEAFTFRLINKTSINTDYILKLEDITVGDPLSKDDVKYGLTKNDKVKIDLVSTIEDGIIDQGTIKGNEIIEYSLRLWIKNSITEISTIQNKSIRYKMNMRATNSVNIPEEEKGIGEVKELAFDETNLGESCKTYDDGVDTFLVGQCQNNYVWYSGKLWRVVLKNNQTGAVKMVTDNAVTVIPYNEENNSNFENSYVDQWLSQEFLPTLHDTSDYLVTDSIWDATMVSSDTPTRPTGSTTVKRAVGLLNVYEYYTTYNNSENLATRESGYLNNGVYWWLITQYKYLKVRLVDSNGNLSYQALPIQIFSVRPSINLKSKIQIQSGKGTLDNPYKLLGDRKETTNGETLLNTRYSGEYITFNNELYRIVATENGLTKITLDSSMDTIMFDRYNTVINFASASIKRTLEDRYQNILETYKFMIEPNTIWYLGIVDGGNYKESVCAIVDVNIGTAFCEKTDNVTTTNLGLPRIGEMFTSQIARGFRKNFWILTTSSAKKAGSVSSSGGVNYGYPSSYEAARQSMYLKSNVVISKDNTGDGTYEHPYDIELDV